LHIVHTAIYDQSVWPRNLEVVNYQNSEVKKSV